MNYYVIQYSQNAENNSPVYRILASNDSPNILELVRYVINICNDDIARNQKKGKRAFIESYKVDRNKESLVIRSVGSKVVISTYIITTNSHFRF